MSNIACKEHFMLKYLVCITAIKKNIKLQKQKPTFNLSKWVNKLRLNVRNVQYVYREVITAGQKRLHFGNAMTRRVLWLYI